MKQAMLAVSFGTCIAEAQRKDILPVEAALARAFPDYIHRRAYTSSTIRRKLYSDGQAVDSPAEAIVRLRMEGIQKITIVPTLISPGPEYARLLALADGLPVSEPLLNGESDLHWMAQLLQSISDEEDRCLLAMYHGSADDNCISRLQKHLPARIFIAAVHGEPRLDALLPQLEALPEKRLVLSPVMLAAGHHARSELAGDNDGSWKKRLQSLGFDVKIRMEGLGSMPQVQRRFVEKARQAVALPFTAAGFDDTIHPCRNSPGRFEPEEAK